MRTTTRTAHLALTGKLDRLTVRGVCELIDHHLRLGRSTIRLDVSDAFSVEDRALDALVEAARLLRAANGGLTVCGVARERLFRGARDADPEPV